LRIPPLLLQGRLHRGAFPRPVLGHPPLELGQGRRVLIHDHLGRLALLVKGGRGVSPFSLYCLLFFPLCFSVSSFGFSPQVLHLNGLFGEDDLRPHEHE
jgi:hypothetical protein